MENNAMQKEMHREYRIDIIRVVGTLLVILAHTTIPHYLLQIRCFDVVALVFISGYCISFQSYFPYLKKRFVRLVIPTWIILIILFSMTYITCNIIGHSQLYNLEKIIKSFLFLNGSVGFIWIVRVYIIIAIITPVIIWINTKIMDDVLFMTLSVVVLMMVPLDSGRYIEHDILYYFSEIVSYGCIASLGFRCKQLDKQGREKTNKYLVILVSLGSVLCLGSVIMCGGFAPEQYKYPPRIPYVAYGITVTTILFLFLAQIDEKITNKLLIKLIEQLSVMSFDIYLVHIIMLSVMNVFLDKTGKSISWEIQYLFVIGFSIAIAYFKTIWMRKIKRIS